MRLSAPVPSQDKGGGFCDGLATHLGKITIYASEMTQKTVERGDRAGGGKRGMEGLCCPMCRLAQEGLSTK